MKNLTKLACACLAAATLLLTGCISVPGVIRDQTKPLSQNGYTVVGEEVTATEVQITVLGFTLSDLRGSAGRRMYKNALAQAEGADALIEYTMDTKGVALPFLTIITHNLTGTPVKTK